MSVLKKLLWIVLLPVGLLVALYFGASYWLLPSLAQKYIPDLVAEQLGVKPAFKSLAFDPLELKLELRDFSLPDQGGQPMLGFSVFAVDIAGWQSLKSRAVIVERVSLDRPDVRLQQDADGRLNVQKIQPKPSGEPAAETANSEPVLVVVHQLELKQGLVAWQDAQGKQIQLQPVDLSVLEFTTRLDDKPTFNLSLDLASGGHLDWQGAFGLAPISSEGSIALKDIKLPPLWQSFVEGQLPVTLKQGLLGLSGEYSAQMTDGGARVNVEKGHVRLSELDVQDPKHAGKLIRVADVTADGVGLDTAARSVVVAALSSKDADIQVWLDKAGQVNYATLFAPDSANQVHAGASAKQAKVKSSAAAPAKSDTPEWKVSLKQIRLDGYQVNFTDHSLSQPVTVQASDMSLLLEDYDLSNSRKLPITFSTKVNKDGQLKLHGQLRLEPLEFVSDLDISKVELKRFQSYVDPYVKLDLIDGDLNTRGHLDLSMAKQLKLKFNGDVNVNHLITRDQVKNKDFVKWAGLALNQLEFDLDRPTCKIGTVILDKPYVRFFIKKDRTTNIDDILVSAAKPAPEAKEPANSKQTKSAPKSEQPYIRIAQILLKNGESDFADYSLILPFVAQMNSLQGEVQGFSSDKDATAQLKLSGKVYDMATVAIDGRYQIQTGDSDITLNYKHMPLPLVTPYMAQFSGYKIEKGQMALDLHYSIKQGQLQAENKIQIDQLTLGEKVENPNAVSLPLELAIALLKDSDGKIKLDFPISGSLDDPQFNVGALVMDVLGNIISKVVASPFNAIASLAADDDQDASEIVFAAGSAELKPEQMSKLDQIATMLKEKPQLNLDVKGLSFEVFDWPVLRSEAVRFILKRMKSGELRDKGERVRAENIELSDSDYKRLLAKFYAEVLPTEIDYTLLGKPRMKHNPDVEFYETARMQLEAIVQPEPERLEALAVARANSIAKHLSEKSLIDRSKVYILATEQRVGKQDEHVYASLSLSVAH